MDSTVGRIFQRPRRTFVYLEHSREEICKFTKTPREKLEERNWKKKLKETEYEGKDFTQSASK